MPLVDSLLTAVVRSDGDALVLHVGEKPYVVAASGPLELSRQGLGLGAMEGMLAQLLTADALRSLREMGAVEHELEDRAAAAGDRFTVVAARGGDDIWIELRRHRRVAPVAAPEPVAVPEPVVAPELAPPVRAYEPAPVVEMPAAPLAAVETTEADVEPALPVEVTLPTPVVAAVAETPVTHSESAPVEVAAPVVVAAEATVSHADMAAAGDAAPDDLDDLPLDPVSESESQLAPVVVASEAPVESLPVPEPDVVPEPAPVVAAAAVPVAAPEPAPVVIAPAPVAAAPASPVYAPAPAVVEVVVPVMAPPAPMPPAPLVVEAPVVAAVPAPVVVPVVAAPAPEPVPMRAAAPVAEPEPPTPVAVPSPQPVAAAAATPSPYDLPGRYDTPMPAAWSTPSSPRFDSHPHESSRYGAVDSHPVLPGLASELDAIERESAAPDSLPAVVLSLTRDGARGSGGGARGGVRPGGIERLLRLAAARGASALYLTTQARPAVRVDGDIRLLDGEAALSSGDVEAAVLELAPEGTRDKESAEWIRDLADVGRVRITTFRDYRGPGALLRMIQARATSADQLGLVREIQALATEPEGLVIVTGPRASGKSTLVSAFVDFINRQRNDYVITLEGQIRLVHESRGSLISQRELRGSASEVVTAARAALRENPDVLVIEDLRSPDVLQVALDAAGSGLLVFVSVTAASATAALERLVDLCPSDQRRNVRAALAEHLRGVVAQVLLRKAGGGRLAARELVLNTNAVAALVSDGQIAQLPRAIDSGRKLGMAPLNDALVAFVQSGAVDVREAYRKADDKAGLLALMRREGIDTSFVERLA